MLRMRCTVDLKNCHGVSIARTIAMDERSS